jgi:hypothetical protein
MPAPLVHPARHEVMLPPRSDTGRHADRGYERTVQASGDDLPHLGWLVRDP